MTEKSAIAKFRIEFFKDEEGFRFSLIKGRGWRIAITKNTDDWHLEEIFLSHDDFGTLEITLFPETTGGAN